MLLVAGRDMEYILGLWLPHATHKAGKRKWLGLRNDVQCGSAAVRQCASVQMWKCGSAEVRYCGTAPRWIYLIGS